MDIVVLEKNGVPMVSSREVAAKFGKQHKNVLRDLDNLYAELSDKNNNDFMRLNFERVQHEGKTSEILMKKDGFMVLAMGFTGGIFCYRRK